MRTILLAAAVCVLLSACTSKKSGNQTVAGTEPQKIELSVSGMSCMGCVETVRSSIAQLDGIDTVSVSLDKANAIVTFKPSVTDTLAIRKAVELNGYKVTLIRPADRTEESNHQ